MIVGLMVEMLVKRVAEKRGLTRGRVETQCRPAAIQRLMMDMCVTMRLVFEKHSNYEARGYKMKDGFVEVEANY